MTETDKEGTLWMTKYQESLGSGNIQERMDHQDQAHRNSCEGTLPYLLHAYIAQSLFFCFFSTLLPVTQTSLDI